MIKNSKKIICGGAIIDEKHVVTSTDCLYNADGGLVSVGDIKVHGGSIYWADGQVQTVRKYFVHPDFQNEEQKKENNIAIIKVNRLP